MRRLLRYTTELPRRIKWFIQRGRRGWSDRDIWSLDMYLCSWLPDALRELKRTNHGVPCEFAGEEGGKEKWNAVLDEIIAGFEAHRRICELDYDYSDMKKFTDRDAEVADKGLALFVRYFGNLWT